MEHTDYFESFGKFLDHVQEPLIGKKEGRRLQSHYVDYSGWYGTKTFNQAFELAKAGWQDGTARIEEYTARFNAIVGSQMEMDTYQYDVTGQDFDLDRVLSGEPECWLVAHPIQVNSPSLQVIKLVVNISASSKVRPEAITTRGAAIAALVNLFERQGRRVEVEVIERCSTSPKEQGDFQNIRILIKSASADLDLAKLAFILTNPSMLRRLCFAAKENCPNRELSRDITRNAYGYPAEVPTEDRGDIYAGRMYGYWDEEMALEWIKTELTKQGIELASTEGN